MKAGSPLRKLYSSPVRPAIAPVRQYLPTPSSVEIENITILAAHLVDAKIARPDKTYSLAYDAHWAAVVVPSIGAEHVFEIVDGNDLVRATQRFLDLVKELDGVLWEGGRAEQQCEPEKRGFSK